MIIKLIHRVVFYQASLEPLQNISTQDNLVVQKKPIEDLLELMFYEQYHCRNLWDKEEV